MSNPCHRYFFLIKTPKSMLPQWTVWTPHPEDKTHACKLKTWWCKKHETCRSALNPQTIPLLHRESITDLHPPKVKLETLTSSESQFCDLPQCDDAALFFLLHLVSFESFQVEYLAALAFLKLLLHWVDIGELCLTEQPLALLQSERLTAVFFHLHLSLACFLHLPFICCGPAYKLMHALSHTNCIPFGPLPLLI